MILRFKSLPYEFRGVYKRTGGSGESKPNITYHMDDLKMHEVNVDFLNSEFIFRLLLPRFALSFIGMAIVLASIFALLFAKTNISMWHNHMLTLILICLFFCLPFSVMWARKRIMDEAIQTEIERSWPEDVTVEVFLDEDWSDFLRSYNSR